MVGRVVAIGGEVSGFAVGDRVFVPEPHQEYAAVAADSVVKLSESIPAEVGVFLSILTVAQLAMRKGRPTPGESVAIVGLGVDRPVYPGLLQGLPVSHARGGHRPPPARSR